MLQPSALSASPTIRQHLSAMFSSVTARCCRAKELIVNSGEDECGSTNLLLERSLRCF
jgi:hypothetical protein